MAVVEELKEKLSSAKCAADIKAIAAELGKELSDDDAEAIFAKVQRATSSEVELSEEALMAVSGGMGPRTPEEREQWKAAFEAYFAKYGY